MQVDWFDLASDHYKYFPDVLTVEQQNLIRTELQSLSLPDAAKIYGKARQEFQYQNFSLDDFKNLINTHSLILDYLKFYSQAEASFGFCSTFPVIAINHYQFGGFIDPHYDESKYRNLIAVYNICGETPFTLYADRQTPLQKMTLKSGSLGLMGAPRNESEKKIRPLHSVGPVISERYAIVIRHEVSSG